jgi:ribosomal protein S8
VFPTIYNYNFSYLKNQISINKLHQNLSFNIIFNKKNLVFLKFLKRFNIIHKFIIIKKNNLICFKVYIHYYKLKPLLPIFNILSKPSKKFLISYQALKLLHKRSGSSIFIVSTSRGVVPHLDAIKHKTGGFIIGFFSI